MILFKSDLSKKHFSFDIVFKFRFNLLDLSITWFLWIFFGNVSFSILQLLEFPLVVVILITRLTHSHWVAHFVSVLALVSFGLLTFSAVAWAAHVSSVMLAVRVRARDFHNLDVTDKFRWLFGNLNLGWSTFDRNWDDILLN